MGHGKRAARKTRGLEPALVDNDVMVIEALDPADGRVAKLRVAGVAALLIAKAHKIGDRIESGRPDRLNDKDWPIHHVAVGLKAELPPERIQGLPIGLAGVDDRGRLCRLRDIGVRGEDVVLIFGHMGSSMRFR